MKKKQSRSRKNNGGPKRSPLTASNMKGIYALKSGEYFATATFNASQTTLAVSNSFICTNVQFAATFANMYQ